MRVFEQTIQYNIVQLGAPTALDCPEKIVEYLRKSEEMNPLVEVFWVIAMGIDYIPIAYRKVSSGTLVSALVRTAEVLHFPIAVRAPVMAVVHNHPSGDPSPSNADIQVTRKLKIAAEAMHIEFTDHVVLGDCDEDPKGIGYFSFKDACLL